MLTPGEWRIVNAVRHGIPNRLIAARQNVSLNAVKYHLVNVFQKLGLTSRAELRHWGGIARGTALARQEREMNQQSGIGLLGQISRTVEDVRTATTWYRDTLGLTHLYSFGALAFFDCGGIRLFLSETKPATSESILYFKVDDVRTSHAALMRKGVVFINAPHMVHRHDDGTEEWMAMFEDCDKRPLAIMSQVRPAIASAER